MTTHDHVERGGKGMGSGGSKGIRGKRESRKREEGASSPFRVG